MEEQIHPEKFQELRALLVGPERELLERLWERVSDPERRTEDLLEILAHAVVLGTRRDARFVEALRAPVGECIKELFRRDMKVFARALFPLILPAIRQAIVEALRSLVQTTNQILDHSLSLKGLRWRWESWRSGVPFSEVVLRHTLVYRVEQVFLIQRHTGLLVGHVNHPEAPTKDGDAVAGMLTAIGDFVQDSFQPEEGGQLDTVNLGELTLWIIHGSSAMLACAIRGIPPRELRNWLRERCEEIHLKFDEELAQFEGDTNAVLGLEPLLNECLSFQRKEGVDGPGGRARIVSPRFIVLALLLAGLLVSWQVRRYRISGQTRALRTELARGSGLWITGIHYEKEGWRVKGLRDPLSEPPERFAERAGIPPDRVRFELSPVLFLDANLVLARARAQLNPPETLTLQLEGDTLKAEGSAPASWLEKAASLTALPPGIEKLDLKGVLADNAWLLKQAQTLLEPPEGVRLGLVEDGLHIQGESPLAWARSLGGRIQRLHQAKFDNVDTTGLRVTEYLEARRLLAGVEGETVIFTAETRLGEEGPKVLEALTRDLSRLEELSTKLGLTLSLKTYGLSDQMGSSQLNRDLRRQRAQFLRDALMNGGRAPFAVSIADESDAADLPSKRGAGLRVNLTDFRLEDLWRP